MSHVTTLHINTHMYGICVMVKRDLSDTQSMDTYEHSEPIPRKAVWILPCDSGGCFGRGDDAIGNPHRAQFSQFELFELTISLKLDKQLPVERFEATVSQSAVHTLGLHQHAAR